MPNGDTQDYVIKTNDGMFRIRAPQGMSQEQALSLAAATNPQFAQTYAQYQAHQQATGTKMEESKAPAYTRAATGTLPAVGGTVGGVLAAPGVVSTPAGIGLGAAGGKAAELGVNRAIFGTPTKEQQALGEKPTDTAPMTKKGAGEIGMEGVLAAGTSVATEAAIAGGGKAISGVRSLFSEGKSPGKVPPNLFGAEERVAGQVAKTSQLAEAEEQIRAGVVKAPKLIRENVINRAYPEINTPVNIMAPAEQAAASAKDVIANAKPSQVLRVSRLANNAKVIEKHLAEFMKDVRAGEPGDAPLWAAELEEMLTDLKSAKELPFAKAQRYNTALNVAIAKGQGYKLPAEVYHALNDTRSVLRAGMEQAAAAEGKLGQLEAANKLNKQFMDDFYNKNAPLKPLLDLKEGMAGRTLKQLSKDGRAVKAIGRWFGADNAAQVQKLLDDPDLAERIKDVTLQSRSPKAYVSKLTREEYEEALKAAQAEEKKATAAFEKEEARKSKVKTGLAVTGGSALGIGGIWKLLNMLGVTGGEGQAVGR